MFTLRIKTDNAAFGDSDDEARAEIAPILKEALVAIDYVNAGTLRDINGNLVGSFKLTRSRR